MESLDLDIMVKPKNNGIGVLGGSFDPPHKGHLKVSLISLRNLKLNKILWVLTKKNPFKKKPLFSLKERIKACKKITKNYKKIEIQYLDDKVKSSNSIKIINYIKNRNKKSNIYFLIGSDGLLNFHKWTSWKKILNLCTLIVFSRKGFDKKAKKSVIVRYLKNNNIIFVKNKKINVSSTVLRLTYQKSKF